VVQHARIYKQGRSSISATLQDNSNVTDRATAASAVIEHANLKQNEKQYTEQIHGSAFMVNNLNYIHKTLKRNSEIPAAITLRFQEAFKSQKDALVYRTFTPITLNVLDVTVTQA
jgi:hypothetical protein